MLEHLFVQTSCLDRDKTTTKKQTKNINILIYFDSIAFICLQSIQLMIVIHLELSLVL